MQGISVCDSVASLHGTSCRLACVARNDLRLFYKISSASRGAYTWHWCAEKLHTRTNRRNMNTTVRTNARWLFGGDGGNSNSNKNANARLERSESANEDILIFYFQLDLQTRIQYALNIEQFDAAKQLREKLAEIETEITRQREAKRGSSKNEAQDKSLDLLRARLLNLVKETYIVVWMVTWRPPEDEASINEWWLSAKQASPRAMHKGIATATILTSWLIWKQRNACIFEGDRPSTTRLLDRFREEAKLWVSAGANGLRVIIPTDWDVH